MFAKAMTILMLLAILASSMAFWVSDAEEAHAAARDPHKHHGDVTACYNWITQVCDGPPAV